jgi:hypothetical protein
LLPDGVDITTSGRTRLPVMPLMGAEGFRAGVVEIVASMVAFDPELVFISAGFDGHKQDPVGGSLGLDAEDYAWATSVIVRAAEASGSACKGRVVSVLEGGYDIVHGGLAKSVEFHVRAMRGAWATHWDLGRAEPAYRGDALQMLKPVEDALRAKGWTPTVCDLASESRKGVLAEETTQPPPAPAAMAAPVVAVDVEPKQQQPDGGATVAVDPIPVPVPVPVPAPVPVPIPIPAQPLLGAPQLPAGSPPPHIDVDPLPVSHGDVDPLPLSQPPLSLTVAGLADELVKFYGAHEPKKIPTALSIVQLFMRVHGSVEAAREHLNKALKCEYNVVMGG